MRLFVKTLYYFILGSIAFGMLALFLTYTLFSRSLPDYNQELENADVTAALEIVRDSYGVPHVLADTDADAFFGLGFVHAQDRLWQMEMTRRRAQGRQAELFGPDMLDADRRARILRFYRSAREDFENLDPGTQIFLQAYADGVNAYLRELSENARGRGAPEFYFSAPEISAWTPADSLAILRMRQWDEAKGIAAETLRARTAMAIGVTDANAFLSYDPIFGDATSTVFGISGEDTLTSSTFFFADIAEPLEAPSKGYFVRLDMDAGPVYGLSYPGIPALFAGFGPRHAWATKKSSADTIDLAILPENLLSDATHRDERISVKDAATFTQNIQQFDNFSILPSALFQLDDLVPPDHAAVLQWTAQHETNHSLTGLIALMQAKDKDQFASASAGITAPMHVAFATRNEIFTLDVGSIPVRPQTEIQNYELPLLASSAGGLWLGVLNGSETSLEALEKVVLVDASAFKDQRLKRLIDQRDIHSFESLKEIQTDVVSASARALLPLIAKELWYSELPTGADPLSEIRSSALDLLAEWNGEMSEHLAQPLIYSAWMWELQRQIIRDELGPVAAEFQVIRPQFLEAAFAGRDGMEKWCDIRPSASTETCEELALSALNVALQRLERAYGPRVESWLWGEAHLSEQTHGLFEKGSMMDWATGIYLPISGGFGTVSETFSASEDGVQFFTRSAPIARMAVDLSRSEASGFILSTGQSGHFLSEYYDNLAPLWRRGEYLPFVFDEDVARAAAAGTITISPPN